MPAFHLKRPAVAFLLVLLVSLTDVSYAEPTSVTKISPALQQALAQQVASDYLVYFTDDVDLSAAPRMERTERRRLVYDRLRAQAQRTHTAARALLQRFGAGYREHYLWNAVEVHGDLGLARQLASLADVVRLDFNAPSRANLPAPGTNLSPAGVDAVAAIEWGVNRVHAPDVWNTYGVHGEGVVVGTADTGVQWDHPALKSHYRGWDGTSADHDYNWHDSIHDAPPAVTCDNDSPAPCDVYGHGTHVTGTMAGDDGAGNQIGVAPGAKWIGCRNMDNAGNGTPARYIECFEFMLAPYPIGGDPLSDGRPELGADIVNNSWTCTVGEGCATGAELKAEVEKLSAAGMLVVAAAGNFGPSCSTVREPPATYAATFSVGATDSGDNIAGFSSRGPVTVDSSNRRKPDVSAPGVSVRSSFTGNAYATISGTSMASPHTSGVAALLWSAVPSLNGNITQTISIIENSADAKTTAQSCGGDSSTAVPNNVYGFGIVNALAAIQRATTLHITKQAIPSRNVISSGDSITYTLAISNAGVISATNVVVTDSVPLNTTYVPMSIVGAGADDSGAPLLRWNLATLAPAVVSGTLALSFRVIVSTPVSPGTVITNTAFISSHQSAFTRSNLVTITTGFRKLLPLVVKP